MIDSPVQLIECPRDAMQGWKTIIPTQKKVDYINSLLQVGFSCIDFGSFVSPKAIPQMADTAEVVKTLDRQGSSSSLLAIVANERGAGDAVAFDSIGYLGFPFSVSPEFQLRNTNASQDQALRRVEAIQEICVQKNRKLVVYLSMAFGNPYGDAWSEEIVFEWAGKMAGLDIGILSLADTVGLATPEQVFDMSRFLIESLPDVEMGVHLHSRPDNWREKLDAAWRAGCRRFDGALKGVGGCPMANDELVGNMDSEKMIGYFQEIGQPLPLNEKALAESLRLASQIFL
jgi:hydroxymethylglutaryl-CoA lyase